MTEEGFRSLVESVADALVVVDADGTVVYANEAAQLLFDPGGETLVGSHFGFPLAPGERTEIDVIGPSKERRIAEMRTRKLDWEGSEAYVATVRDVTQRHALERSLHDLVSTVSHEIRSPLVTIDGLIDLMAAEADEGEARDHLDVMSRQVDRVLRLANHLLTFARLDSDRLESEAREVDISSLLDELCEEFQARGHEVSLDAAEGLVAWADPDHVRRILENYLDNATKYGEPPFRIEASRDEGDVVLRVVDRGPGVDESFVPQLFDRFSRAEKSRTDGSSGLGLPIVLGLARASGGDAWYEQGEEGGSVFAVRLPCPG